MASSPASGNSGNNGVQRRPELGFGALVREKQRARERGRREGQRVPRDAYPLVQVFGGGAHPCRRSSTEGRTPRCFTVLRKTTTVEVGLASAGLQEGREEREMG
jgi:hypothetical protein